MVRLAGKWSLTSWMGMALQESTCAARTKNPSKPWPAKMSLLVLVDAHEQRSNPRTGNLTANDELLTPHVSSRLVSSAARAADHDLQSPLGLAESPLGREHHSFVTLRSVSTLIAR
jgi:hypothetical protein